MNHELMPGLVFLINMLGAYLATQYRASSMSWSAYSVFALGLKHRSQTTVIANREDNLLKFYISGNNKK